MGVCTKERKGVTAAVLMATPCTNSLGLMVLRNGFLFDPEVEWAVGLHGQVGFDSERGGLLISCMHSRGMARPVDQSPLFAYRGFRGCRMSIDTGCSYQAFRETFFEHHLRDKRKSSRSDKLCYSTLDTDESTRKSGRVPTLYQEGRYSKTALSQFASIDAKNKAIGCTLLEARTSQEQLKHHAEVAVEPFTVPRAMGGANLTRLLEKPPVSGSVPLATVLRPATTRGSPRQQSESSGLHIMQSALASRPAPELSEEQRQSELLHLAFLPTSAQVSRAHLRNSIDIKHPTRLSSSFAAKSLRNPFPSESQPSLIGASERVAKRRAETRQASPRRVQSESSSMLSLVNEGLAIGPIKVVKVHRGTDDELDIMGRPGSRGSSSARSSSSPASPYSRSKRLQFVEEKGARQLHTGANNSSMSLDCAPHDHHHSPPIQPSDNWGFGWSSHGLSSEDTAASPEVALSAFAWTRRRPILSSTTRAKHAAAASPRASPRLGQSAAALRPLRLKMDGVVSVETGDASPRRPQPGATPHHGSSSYSATVRALSSGRALPGQSSQYAAAAAAAAAAKVHPAAHGASTHRSSGSSVANWSTKPYASSSPLHGSPRNAVNASTLAAHRRRKQPAPLAGLMPPVPGPWTSPRAQLHTHRGGGGQLSASASIPNTHRSASPPVPVHKSGAEADLVRVAGGGGGGVGAAF